MSLPTPNTRKEQYLNAIATGNASGLPTPITREEEYLDAIAKNGGGGSGDGDMKKSVYDSDLAVANAGGISAFVSDAVSNKVDKVEGKGLSTNDYSDTEKGKVADNTAAIEAIENVLGAKNQFALAYNLGTTGLSTANDELKNTLTDTASEFVLHFRGIKNDDTQDFLLGDVISSAGKYEYAVTITSNYKSLLFKHNGASQDLGIYIPAVATGRWILSFNVVGYNPSVVGGLEITEIMLCPAGTDPTYVPYAMTNRELTERSQFKLVQTIECNNTYLVGSLSLYANELTRQCFLAGTVQTAYDDIVNLWRPIASIDTKYIPKEVAFNAVAISNAGGAVVNRGYVSKNTSNAVVAYTIDGTHSAGNTVDIYLTWIY